MIYLCRLRLLLVAILSVLTFAGCSANLPTSYQQLEYPELTFQLPDVETMVLDNGIRLYLKADDELPLVQVTAMIGSGAISTPQEKTGFDDLFGSVWRSGGAGDRTPQALDEYLDFLAADLSSSLGTYSAQLDLSLRSEDLDAGLSILADLLLRPRFDSERLELARLQAQEQLRRQNDTPGAISRRLLLKALYPDHYLGRTATESSLASITRQDLVDFQEAYFAPNNLWIAVSGDFNRETLLEDLKQKFGDWPRRNVPVQEIPPVEAPAAGLIQLADKDLQQTSIVIGDLGLSKENPDQYAVRVLNYILGGGGFNSRMMREIRSNRGLAYSAYSYFQVGRRLPGPFVAGTETKNVSVVPAIGLIREIMNDLRDKPVSDEELTLAKESQINSFVFGFENTHAVVSQQMSLAFFDYPENYLSDYRDNIAAVTVADVQRVAQEFIHPSRQQVVLVGHPENFGDELQQFGLPVVEVDLDETP